MLFNSYIFILFFLPLVLSVYFGINLLKKYKIADIWLIGMSLWFYAYFNISYLFLICGSIIINYLISRLINKDGLSSGYKKSLLLFGILLNLGSIFYFKYFNFFIINVNMLFKQSFETLNIILPLGISFFTFQQISYLVDSYRGETKEYGFIEYALFVSFFPQLIAGPIVLHNEMIPQFREEEKRKPDAENLGKGIYIFAIGLFKKVLIADTFAKAVNWGFGTIDTLTSMEALIVSLCYTFQLYFDFSGYCDMAIGIGHMFNIQLPFNFNSPYKATSVEDFWDRWHMSLTRFLRQYVYFPLGGSRRGKVRTYINIMIVFFVSGIWHGANWTYILWGIIHGIANCLNRLFRSTWGKLNVVIQWFVTFVFIDFTMVVFRSDSIREAGEILKKIILFHSFTIRDELADCFLLPEFRWGQNNIKVWGFLCGKTWGMYMWLFLAGAFFAVLKLRNSSEIEFRPTLPKALQTIFLMVWSVFSLAGVSVFLYFNF